MNNLREAVEVYYEDEKPEIDRKQIFLTTMEVVVVYTCVRKLTYKSNFNK